jgi:Icc-related predicted phosphoesterase
MLFQYASDLHLEFPENKAHLTANPIVPKANILLLAGDILPFILIAKHRDFFDYLADNFEHTYWVPGNHEYYHFFDAAKKSGALCENIRTNVSLVNNWAVNKSEVRLIFSTMWTELSPAHEWEIEKNMNDFRIIKYNGHRFSTQQYNQLHADSLLFIKNELVKDVPDKKVVVTHHVPTYLNYPDQYKGSVLSEAFAVELFDLITEMQPAFWIYGHHHVNTSDFKIEKTQLITNQLGYVRYDEHRLFSPDKTFLL